MKIGMQVDKDMIQAEFVLWWICTKISIFIAHFEFEIWLQGGSDSPFVLQDMDLDAHVPITWDLGAVSCLQPVLSVLY